MRSVVLFARYEQMFAVKILVCVIGLPPESKRAGGWVRTFVHMFIC